MEENKLMNFLMFFNFHSIYKLTYSLMEAFLALF